MKTETNAYLVELSQWLNDADETVNTPQAALHHGVPGDAHAARVKFLIEEVHRLRGIVECIATVACSEAFRKLSQQGYGDIEELCHKALRSPADKPPTYRVHALETVCTRCQKASFDCECGEEES